MIGGNSYDDYLRDQERKNKGYGLSGRDTYRPEVPYSDDNQQMTQTPEPRKKVQPVSIFFILFGSVFFLFGLFFVVILFLFLPTDEGGMWFMYMAPGIFMFVGMAIVIAGIHYGMTGQTPKNVTINGVSAEDYNRIHGYETEKKEETSEDEDQDTSRLSTDWKS